ncbi:MULTISPECIES: hypothetical protein [Flavobacterium]|uniref:hypothetical protein n=1 Tax=Flavobacterium TaxID=237 RepID=UPI0021148447|nr:MULTISPECIES: hypothetical protein [Flavobacterium]UUF12405.1 hypothetical protein NLJ00_14200 [Flavobacterium panici]
MKQQLRLIIFLFGSGVYAQVGIGTPAPNNSAQLEIVSSNKGLLIPKLNLTSLTDNLTITSGNVEGLIVYNITNVSGMPPGFYYWSSGQWNKLLNKKDLPLSSGPGAPTALFPANPAAGNIYVNETTGEIYTFKGGGWSIQSSSSVSTDPGNIIIQGTDGKAFLDAVVGADKLGKNVTSSDGSISGVQNKSVLADMNLQVKVDNTTLEVNPANGVQVKDSGITIPKIASGGSNKVLVTDAAGAVAWINKDAFETVVDMTTIEGLGTIASPLMVKDLGIVTAKLADDAVTSAKILNGTILSEDIASGGVNKVLVTDASGAVAWINKDSFETVVDMTTIEGLGTIASPLMVKDLGIVTAKLADDAVTSAKILNGTILSEDIASGGVNKVLVTDASGAVAWINKDSFETVVDMTTIEGLGTIASPLMVKDLGIVTAKLADDAVTSAKILNGTILSEDIASGGINKVLVTDASGAVAWINKDSFETVVDMTTIEGLGTITSPLMVKDLGIVTAKIADNAVTTAKIAPGSNDQVLVTDAAGVVAWLDKSAFGAIADQVTIEGLGTTASPFLVKDLGIVTAKLADDAVTTGKILNETILSEDIKDGEVATVDIASGGNDKVLVTDAAGVVAWLDKSAFGAIADQVTIEGLGTTASPFLVKDLGIVTAKLADDAVTTGKILNGTILSEDIASGGNDKVLVTDAAGVVAWLDKSAFGAIADQVTIEGLGTTASPFLVKDLGIVTAKLADDAVTTGKILNETILSEDIKDGEVATVDIASGGNDKVLVTDAAGVVAWLDKSAFGAIADQVTIEGLGTTASPFLVKDLGIVTAKLADDAVTTGKILNGTILSEDIASGGNDKVLVTDAAGVVAWLDKSAFGAIADQVTIEGLGTTASPFLVKDLGIVTAKLADNAVTTTKIASGGNDKVLVTDAAGVVAWLDKSAFGAIADQVTIEGLGTTASPFLVKDLGIVTAKLADDAVTTGKILNETILSEDIKDGEVATVDIASGGSDKVLVTDAAGVVAWLDKSAFGAIADQVTIEGLGTTASPFLVKDLGIVTAKLADDAVTTGKILNETILSEDIKDGEVATVDIASGGNDKVLVTDASGVVAWLDKSAFGAIADQVTIEGLGTTSSPFLVKDLGIVTAKLADDAVTTGKILNETILSEDIKDGEVATVDIASGGNDKVLVTDASGVVAWLDKSAFGAIADQITIEGLGTTASPFLVKDLGIVTAKLADDAVTTGKILNGTILSEDIASGGNDKVLVTDAAGVVAWLDKSAFGAIADQVTIEGLGTTASPFLVKDLGIATAKIADNAVTTAKIAPGSNDQVLVTDAAGVVAWLDKSAFGAIADQVTIEGLGTTASPFLVKDLGIVTAKIADNAVTTTKIAPGSNDQVLVTDAAGVVAWLDKSAFGAIADQVTIEGLGTTASPFLVKDLGIVTAKLADDAVTTGKILNETILSEDIKDGEVATVDIASGGNDKVLVTDAAGVVAWLDKSAFGAIADQVTIEGLGTTASPFLVKDLGIVTAKLADDAVTTGKILNETILSEDIKDGEVATVDIASGGNDKVLVTDAAGVVAWLDKSAFGAIADQVTIEGLGTTASPFLVKDLGIVTAKLADDAVTTGKILNGTILSEDIASGGNDKVLVTDAAGVVAWLDKSAFGAIADQVTIEGLGTTASPFLVKDLGIVTAKLADNAVTTTKIASGGNDKVLVTDAAGVVAWLDKSAFGAIADQSTIAGLGTTTSPFLVKDSGITVMQLADNAVTTPKIIDGAVTTAKILNETILSEDIKDGEVKTTDIADKNVTVEKINNGAANQVLRTDALGVSTEWGAFISADTGNLIIPGTDRGVFINQATIKANETVTTLSGALPTGNLIGTYTNELSNSVDINETVTAITGALTTGHDIGTYKNEANADVILKETITRISQDNTTGVIRYFDEEGVPDEDVNTAEELNVISANPNNAIKVGTDGGAYINSIAKVVYSAEYAGGVLMADGTNNIGTLTSDNTGAPDWINFYEWSSGQATVQDYDVILRFTVPSDFTAWDAASPIQISYRADAGTNLSGFVYAAGGALLATIPVSTAATWTNINVTSVAALTAGSTGIIVLKLSSKVSDSTAKIRIGDITLNYKK